MITFKTNSTKSNAKRFLTATCKVAADKVDNYLTQVAGQWGTYVDANGAAVPFEQAQPLAEGSEESAADQQTANETQDNSGQPEPANAADEHPAEDEPAPAPAPNVFSAFAMAQLTAPSRTPAAEQERPARKTTPTTGVRIEKNRAEQNGVRRPSVGTVCARVWDTCDAMQAEQGSAPALAHVKARCVASGINPATAQTQYALWRKFHNILGRIGA